MAPKRDPAEPPPVAGIPAWPLSCPAAAAALRAALADGSWGRYSDRHTLQLAAALAELFQSEFIQLCCSGTIAVELALRGVGVRPDDEVIVAAYDFPGNFRAVEAIGATPVLVDVARDTWSIDPSSLEQIEGKKIAAVLVSHLHGGLAPMSTLKQLADERGWHVVEDACQVPGATVEGRPAGTWGDAGVLSFGGSKLLTAGRGGAVLTSDRQIHQRGKLYGERGNQAFPLSELQAAVLLPQLEELPQRHATRAATVAIVREETAPIHHALRPIAVDDLQASAYYKHAWSYVPAESDPSARDRLLALLWSKNAPLDVGFRGFAERSTRRCRKPVDLPNSRRLAASTVLLHHPVLLAEPTDPELPPWRATADVIRWAVDQVSATP